MNPQYKYCTRCGQPALPTQLFCHQCGFQYAQTAPPPPPLGFGYSPHQPIQSEVNLPLILIMWMLTAGCMLTASISLGVSLLLDIPAFVIAIILMRSRSRGDKINGGIKLALEGLACIIVFAITVANGPQSPSFGNPLDAPKGEMSRPVGLPIFSR